MLTIHDIAKLPGEEARDLLQNAPASWKREMQYNWRFWARESQIPPEGNWQIWLILSGRGWGKSRCGAEWVRERIRQMTLVNLVGATADDARDIMVLGESGILAICPPDERPYYNKSDRKLIWPNGAESLIFTADEPERLRGKQSMGLWMDEVGCLTGNSLISTDRGLVPIREVVRGDEVWTRAGLRRVLHSWRSHSAAEVYELVTESGNVLTATGTHPVWVPNFGWKPLSSLHNGDTIGIWNKSLCGEAVGGILTKTDTTKTEMADFSIGLFIQNITEGLRRVWIYTIGMRTLPTTLSKISKHSPGLNTVGVTRRPALLRGLLKSTERFLSLLGARVSQVGVSAKTAGKCISRKECGPSFATSTARWPIIGNTGFLKAASTRASDVEGSFTGLEQSLNSVPTLVRWFHRDEGIRRARSAVPRSTRSRARSRLAVKNVQTDYDRVVSVKRKRVLQPVYDLQIEGVSEFFADGILVHNSWRYDQSAFDMAMMGLRIGPDPRAVLTTTPKPRKLILDLASDPNTVVVRGTTYENRANLNPAFFQQIIKRYEGTRLGRQELLAELLMDNPGALWQRAEIDLHRVADHPPLVKVVVGVDPEASSGEDAAETGIIVAGLGIDGHGYVIDDASIRGTPYQWGLQVAAAYARHRANVVLAEINNGGEMVTYTIQSVAPHVPVDTIHASRGKYTRAEPVAALYEKGMVHHVGSFSLLEDQLVQWEPGEGESPDRLDALTWSLTRLFGLDQPWRVPELGYVYGKGVKGWLPR